MQRAADSCRSETLGTGTKRPQAVVSTLIIGIPLHRSPFQRDGPYSTPSQLQCPLESVETTRANYKTPQRED